METNVRTPQDIFMLPQHLVVPPFQRPYVWEKDEQFWQDVRLAELRLGSAMADAKHFLGAIVVQAQEPILGDLQANSIIDGQQRLTTLQLLMDAAAAALESVGQDDLAGQLLRSAASRARWRRTSTHTEHRSLPQPAGQGDALAGARRSVSRTPVPRPPQNARSLASRR